MIQQLNSFNPGDKFKFAGKSATIYGKKVFTVTGFSGGFLKADAVDWKGKPDGIEYFFTQTNFNYYSQDLIRLQDKP